MSNKKGIVFKQSNQRKLLLVHKDSLNAYIDSLPKSENGWVAFEFSQLSKISERGKFADIVALEKTTT